MRMTDYLTINDDGAKRWIECRCGHTVCAAEENFKNYVTVIESPLRKIGPLADMSGQGAPFVFREFCCPQCATLLATECALKDEPFLHDIELKPKPTRADDHATEF